MPTVKYMCQDSGRMKKKTFPYNAVGKAQATEFAKTMSGSMKNNPGYGMEKKNEVKLLMAGRTQKKRKQNLPGWYSMGKKNFDTYPSAYANMAAKQIL